MTWKGDKQNLQKTLLDIYDFAATTENKDAYKSETTKQVKTQLVRILRHLHRVSK